MSGSFSVSLSFYVTRRKPALASPPGHQTRSRTAASVARTFILMLPISSLYQYAFVLAPSLALNAISL